MMKTEMADESYIASIAEGLQQDDEGIWFSESTGKVSYPDYGHQGCFELEDGSFWFRHRNRCIIAGIHQFPPQDKANVFDIGGGNGFVARGLQEAGYRVVLVEPGPTGALNAKRRGVKRVIRATTDSAGLKDGIMAGAGLFDVVEHIEDDLGFLRSLKPKLRPGGRLYITVPLHGWLWSQEDVSAGHFRRYTLSSMTKLLERSGFTVEFSTGFFAPLILPIALLRALPWRLMPGKANANEPEIARRDHQVDQSISLRLIERLLRREEKRIASGKRSRIGASGFFVARRD